MEYRGCVQSTFDLSKKDASCSECVETPGGLTVAVCGENIFLPDK